MLIEALGEWTWLLVFLAGLFAGLINGVVGSGTLISFPILLLLGFPPIAANISSNLGLVPGSFASVIPYRSTVFRDKKMLAKLLPLSAVGSLMGSLLLVLLPSAVFAGVVPVLIAMALVVVLIQPVVQERASRRAAAAARGDEADDGKANPGRHVPIYVILLMPLLGMYGGYFGAAQGILLLALLGIALNKPYAEVNGFKNLLAFVACIIASVSFIVAANDQIDWVVVGLIAIGSTIGGVVGARSAQKLPQGLYRAAIVIVGIVALVTTIIRG